MKSLVFSRLRIAEDAGALGTIGVARMTILLHKRFVGGPNTDENTPPPIPFSNGRVRIKARRKEAVWAGDITVNGSVVKNISFQFNPEQTRHYRGDVLELPEEHVTLILNKPPGYVCSRINKHERSLGKTPVFDLLPDHLSQRDKDRMLTVGRLDEATTGMLVLTTDGRTVNRVWTPNITCPRSILFERQNRSLKMFLPRYEPA